MREQHDTVIIGGGQAGLAMSYYLRDRGREHIILERKRVAERWHSERWDSLAFQFPNWALQLPGFVYKGENPDTFAHYREVASFVEDYARFIDAPVRCSSEVSSVMREEDTGKFVVGAKDLVLEASRVVVATGPFQRPSLPALSTALPRDVFQVHASAYRNPDQLPAGAVLVVGSGASGCQITEELYQSGRTVYFSVSRHRRAPRRYRGRDLTWWLISMGRMDQRINSFPGRQMPPSVVITGVNGGHDVNIRNFGRDGVVILGRLIGVDGNKVSFGNDAEEVLAGSDKAYLDFKSIADEYVDTNRLELESEEPTVIDNAPIKNIPSLDLSAANITSVVWGTGYDFDFSWIDIPVLNDRGAPVQERGVTDCRGLYFLGLHWMHTFKSGVLFGVGDDAAYLADHIDATT
jgi:putative flavoprotein involved in K+ transport